MISKKDLEDIQEFNTHTHVKINIIAAYGLGIMLLIMFFSAGYAFFGAK